MIYILTEFTAISKVALNILLPFYGMYLCETVFLDLTVIKSNNEETMKNVEDTLHPVFIKYSAMI